MTEPRQRTSINRLARLWYHAITGIWTVKRCFPDSVLDRIEAVVAEGEVQHSAEVRIAIEHSLAWWQVVWSQISARNRALEVFSDLHVWDTEANNGVLLYVLLADHAVEIVADRGASTCIDQAVWDHACQLMHDAFQYGRYDDGIIEAVRHINAELAREFPAGTRNPDELPNRPAIL